MNCYKLFFSAGLNTYDDDELCRVSERYRFNFHNKYLKIINIQPNKLYIYKKTKNSLIFICMIKNKLFIFQVIKQTEKISSDCTGMTCGHKLKAYI